MKIIKLLLFLNLSMVAAFVSGQETISFTNGSNYLRVYNTHAEFRFGNRIGCGEIEKKKDKIIIHDGTYWNGTNQVSNYHFHPAISPSDSIELKFEVRSEKDSSLIDSREFLLFGNYHNDKYVVAWPDQSGDLRMMMDKSIKEIQFIIEVQGYTPQRFPFEIFTTGRFVIYLSELTDEYLYFASTVKDYKIKCKYTDDGIKCMYNNSKSMRKYKRQKLFLQRVK